MHVLYKFFSGVLSEIYSMKYGVFQVKNLLKINAEEGKITKKKSGQNQKKITQKKINPIHPVQPKVALFDSPSK